MLFEERESIQNYICQRIQTNKALTGKMKFLDILILIDECIVELFLEWISKNEERNGYKMPSFIDISKNNHYDINISTIIERLLIENMEETGLVSKCESEYGDNVGLLRMTSIQELIKGICQHTYVNSLMLNMFTIMSSEKYSNQVKFTDTYVRDLYLSKNIQNKPYSMYENSFMRSLLFGDNIDRNRFTTKALALAEYAAIRVTKITQPGTKKVKECFYSMLKFYFDQSSIERRSEYITEEFYRNDEKITFSYNGWENDERLNDSDKNSFEAIKKWALEMVYEEIDRKRNVRNKIAEKVNGMAEDISNCLQQYSDDFFLLYDSNSDLNFVSKSVKKAFIKIKNDARFSDDEKMEYKTIEKSVLEMADKEIEIRKKNKKEIDKNVEKRLNDISKFLQKYTDDSAVLHNFNFNLISILEQLKSVFDEIKNNAISFKDEKDSRNYDEYVWFEIIAIYIIERVYCPKSLLDIAEIHSGKSEYISSILKIQNIELRPLFFVLLRDTGEYESFIKYETETFYPLLMYVSRYVISEYMRRFSIDKDSIIKMIYKKCRIYDWENIEPKDIQFELQCDEIYEKLWDYYHYIKYREKSF